eukprot:TRINITY_DN13267_c0_g1_i1.p1 TRINITY_DN13267_c0_g1~~TRINITY_DN13267_c0_g1_i1.p1  ORF type:complete len:1401 (+),score=189.67 TRINITY_DN13267_c0_g1_i1:788-4990(+)
MDLLEEWLEPVVPPDSLEAFDDNGNSPLHVACAQGDLRKVRWLVLHARVNAVVRNPITGDTPLHLASRWGQDDVVAFLLATGVDTTITNLKGETAAAIAGMSTKKVFVALEKKMRLVFTRQPASEDVGAGFSVRVEVVDGTGKKAHPDVAVKVTLRLILPPVSTSQVGGEHSARLEGQLVRHLQLTGCFFSGLFVTLPGQNYLLAAQSDNEVILPAVSEPFNVTCSLCFIDLPQRIDVADSLLFRVAACDQQGNVRENVEIRLRAAVHETFHPLSLRTAEMQPFIEAKSSCGVATFTCQGLDHVAREVVLIATAPNCAAVLPGLSSGITVGASLTFTQQPGDIDVSESIKTHLAIVDSRGNIVRNANFSATLTVKQTGELTTCELINGEAVSSNLRVITPGTGYTLLANAPGQEDLLAACESKPFNVTAQLIFSEQPPNTTHVGGPFAVSVVVADNFGRVVESSSPHVALSLVRSSSEGPLRPGSAALGVGMALNGVLAQRAVQGRVRFVGLSVEQPQTDYTLVAVAQGNRAIRGGTSNQFEVTAELRFTTFPAEIQLGQRFAVAVQVQSPSRCRFPAVASVALSLVPDSPYHDLSGPFGLVQRAERGEALFEALTVPFPGVNYRLAAVSQNHAIAAAISPPFSVRSRLVVVQGPPATLAVNQPFNLRLCILTSQGDICKFQYTVTICLRGEGVGADTLCGETNRLVDSDGYCNFRDLRVALPGTAFEIEATCSNPAVTSALTRAFDATAQFEFCGDIGPTVPVGELFPAVVRVVDIEGKVVSCEADATLAIEPCLLYGLPFSTLASDVLLSGRVIHGRLAGDATVSTPASSLIARVSSSNRAIKEALSNTFTATASLAFTQFPASIAAQTGFEVEITVVDGLGNIVVSSCPRIALVLKPPHQNEHSTAQLISHDNGGFTLRATAGRATFGTVQVNTPVPGAYLIATCLDNAGILPAKSPLFDVTASLQFVLQPNEKFDVGGSFCCAVECHNASGERVPLQSSIQISLVVPSQCHETEARTPLLVGALLAGGAEEDGFCYRAVFSRLSVDTPCSGLRLKAVALQNTAVASAISQPFVVAAALRFGALDAEIPVGEEFQVQLEVVTVLGLRVTTACCKVELWLENSSGAKQPFSHTGHIFELQDGALLVCGLIIKRPLPSYRLHAEAVCGEIAPAASEPFAVIAHLGFLLQPTPPVCFAATGVRSSVHVVDSAGEPVEDATTEIRLSLLSGHHKGCIQGAVLQRAVNGAAEFYELLVDTPGKGYRLQAIATNAAIRPVVSDLFHVTAQLVFVSAPSDVHVWRGFSVAVEVHNGECRKCVTAPFPIRLRLAEGSASSRLGGGTLLRYTSAGTAVFTELLLDAAGPHRLVAYCDNQDACILEAVSQQFFVEGTILDEPDISLK